MDALSQCYRLGGGYSCCGRFVVVVAVVAVVLVVSHATG